MDKPLTVWYCDVCGERIEDSKIGYVIWQTTKEMKAHNFKIIHQSRCDIREFHSSSALEDFLGPKGLAYLLTFLSLGPIKMHIGQTPHCDIIDFDEFGDFFRRVQTPYYEEARRAFGNEDLLDWFADSNQLSPYLPDTLKEIIERYGSTR